MSTRYPVPQQLRPRTGLPGAWNTPLTTATGGDLAGSADMVFGAGSSTLAGAGALAGVAALTFGAGASTVTGVGALAGVAAMVFGGTDTMNGAGALAGASAMVFTPAGDLTGAAAGSIAGAAAMTLDGLAAIGATGTLAGICVLSLDLAGVLVRPTPSTDQPSGGFVDYGTARERRRLTEKAHRRVEEGMGAAAPLPMPQDEPDQRRIRRKTITRADLLRTPALPDPDVSLDVAFIAARQRRQRDEEELLFFS